MALSDRLSWWDGLPTRALMVLAGTMFVSQATEFLPGGMIPLIANEFRRSASDAGHLVSVFALTVVLSTVPSSWVARKASRKRVVIVALVGIGAGAVLAAAAPTFEWLLVARLLGGVFHGLFWSSAAAYAANLVPVALLGRAVAITSTGGALAGILGIPLGNALAYSAGWRFAFLAIGVLATVMLVLVARMLPNVDLDVPILLGLSGIAGAGGLAIILRSADRRPWALLVGAMSTDIVLYVLLFASGHARSLIAVIAVSLSLGLAFAPIPTLLQARNMQAASPSLRSFAAALQTTAINVGIGGGALIGGLSLDRLGLLNLPPTAALIVAVSLVALLHFHPSRRRS